MLKVTLTAAEFAALPELVQAHYKAAFDGSYSLDLGPSVFTTDKDPKALMNALEHERNETAKAKAAADRLEEEARKEKQNKLTNVDEIKKHYESELDKVKKENAAAEKKRKADELAQKQNTADRMADAEALKLASDLFGTNAMLLQPHIAKGVKGIVDENGQPQVQYVDMTNGLPLLEQNAEKVRETLSTNPIFKPMVVVSNASGGSANGDQTPSLVQNKEDGTPKAYGDYTSGELVRLKRDQPEDFKKLLETRGK